MNKNNKFTIPPHGKKGILIPKGYAYEISGAGREKVTRVKIDGPKLIPPDDYSYVFSNPNDPPVFVKIRKTKNEKEKKTKTDLSRD